MESQLLDAPFQPVTGAVAALSEILDEARDTDVWALSDDDLSAVVERCEALVARVTELGLRLIREVDARDLARREGAPSTAAWLRHRLRLRPGEARARVELANRLCQQLAPIDHGANVHTGRSGWAMPATAAALAAGTVSIGHAEAVAAVMADLPGSLSTDELRTTEQQLADWAQEYNPTDVRNLGRALTELLDQDSLEEKEQREFERRELRLSDRGDGCTRISGRLDNESAQLVRAALDRLAKPQPAGAAGEPDGRTKDQRNADALSELARRFLDDGDQPAGHAVRPHLSVLVRLETLQGMAAGTGLPVGEVGGHPLSAEAVRRIGCDADVTRIVLDPGGRPLHVGRTQRTITSAQWAALVARDGGCAFPGCTRPPEWCEAHHIVWWRHGGRTDLTNLVLLCGYHHRQVHHYGWDIETADGLPQFLPPPWIDPARRPRHNTRPRPHTVSGPGP